MRRLSLLELVRRSGPFTTDEAVAFGRELVRVALDEPGPVRLGGVTGGNLFLMPDGRVGAEAVVANGLWMPPEVVRGVPPDERSDVFCVGLALHAALVGGYPVVRAVSDLESLQRMLEVDLVPLPAGVSEALREVLKRATEREPSRRQPSLAVLGAELGALPEDVATLNARVAKVWSTLTPTPRPNEPRDDSVEANLLRRVRAGDDAARLVLADRLESTGSLTEAQWLRAEHAMRGLRGEAQLAALTELRRLKVSDAFIAAVARPELEACAVSFGFRCPRTWSALALTDDPMVRWCTACEERVHFAADVEAAEAHAMQGRCVAVADHVVRPDEPLGSRVEGNYLGRGPARRVGRKR